MEILQVLEKKIETLVALIKQLKEANQVLEIENLSLSAQIAQLQNSLLKENENVSEERAATKQIVDELIASIDALVQKES